MTDEWRASWDFLRPLALHTTHLLNERERENGRKKGKEPQEDKEGQGESE